jgi:hypothetical protein
MSEWLPSVDSTALMDVLTDFVPDDLINGHWPMPRRRGRRFQFSAAQLWRVHALSPLTGGKSFNGLRRALAEQRSLRRFAHLPNQEMVPDVRMLHEFRSRLGVGGWRWINDQLVRQVLEIAPLRQKTVTIIDATDLPARTCDKKKRMGLGVPGGQR